MTHLARALRRCQHVAPINLQLTSTPTQDVGSAPFQQQLNKLTSFTLGMEPAQVVHIDGSQLEGGGQILRNATALSAITGRSVHVERIRAGRKNPGLSAQHLTGLQLVANITKGILEGGTIKSTSISFYPGPKPPAAGSYEADIKTAGSCTLMVQQSLPVLLFTTGNEGNSSQPRPDKRRKGSCTSVLTLRGGTDAAFAPPIGYLQHVFLPTFKRLIAPLGSDFALDLIRRGFYPKGGGVVQLTAPALPPGTPLPAWQLTDRGYLVKITGFVVTAGKLRTDIGQRMATSAKQNLKDCLHDPEVLFGAANAAPSSSSVPPSSDAEAPGIGSSLQQHQHSNIPRVALNINAVQESADRAFGDGGSIVLVAETSTGCLFGASALAERGLTAEAVGAMAARDLLEELRTGAAVDHWMQDQLIVFMALANGHSSMLCGELTMHTRTAIAIAEQLLPAVNFSIRTLPVSKGADSSGSSKHDAQLLYLVDCTGAGTLSATQTSS